MVCQSPFGCKLCIYRGNVYSLSKIKSTKKVVIVSHSVDPIIFQYCPYGVLIYTMWGKEDEYKVFEKYKKLRTMK